MILFYTKADDWAWNPIYTPYDPAYIESKYRHQEEGTGRRFRLSDLTAAKPGGDTSYEWHGRHPYKGRYWAYSRDKMDQFYEEGRIRFPAKSDGVPELKRYLDEQPGVPLQDLWTDLDPINAKAAERLGYPTQKPEALLERIIEASSNPGDVVLDPFCGCGTAIAVSERLERRWIGIDITFLATHLIKSRLADTFGDSLDVKVIGEPTTKSEAEALAKEDPFQFEVWALSKVNARNADKRKGADRGVDGRFPFHETLGGKTRQAIISVKSGRIGPQHVRDLRGVIEREEAEIGVLITMREPTPAMRAEAATAGVYRSGSEGVGTWGDHPRMQLLTIQELLEGKEIDKPPSVGSFPRGWQDQLRPPKHARRHMTEPLFPNGPGVAERSVIKRL